MNCLVAAAPSGWCTWRASTSLQVAALAGWIRMEASERATCSAVSPPSPWEESRQMKDRFAATASITAAINRHRAATEYIPSRPPESPRPPARASVPVPQATTGIAHALISQCADRDRPRTSATSIISRSAPFARQHVHRLLDSLGMFDGCAAIHRDPRRVDQFAVERSDDHGGAWTEGLSFSLRRFSCRS